MPYKKGPHHTVRTFSLLIKNRYAFFFREKTISPAEAASRAAPKRANATFSPVLGLDGVFVVEVPSTLVGAVVLSPVAVVSDPVAVVSDSVAVLSVSVAVLSVPVTVVSELAPVDGEVGAPSSRPTYRSFSVTSSASLAR